MFEEMGDQKRFHPKEKNVFWKKHISQRLIGGFGWCLWGLGWWVTKKIHNPLSFPTKGRLASYGTIGLCHGEPHVSPFHESSKYGKKHLILELKHHGGAWFSRLFSPPRENIYIYIIYIYNLSFNMSFFLKLSFNQRLNPWHLATRHLWHLCRFCCCLLLQQRCVFCWNYTPLENRKTLNMGIKKSPMFNRK